MSQLDPQGPSASDYQDREVEVEVVEVTDEPMSRKSKEEF